MISPSMPMARGTQISWPNASGDPLGDARLAVARRAEEKQTAAGVHGRAESIEHFLAENQVSERPAEVLDRGLLADERLGLDACDIVFQRDGRARRSRC